MLILIYMCSVYQLCQQAAVLVMKTEKILPVLFSDPKNKIILGSTQVVNMVDTNQALPQQEADFHDCHIYLRLYLFSFLQILGIIWKSGLLWFFNSPASFLALLQEDCYD